MKQKKKGNTVRYVIVTGDGGPVERRHIEIVAEGNAAGKSLVVINRALGFLPRPAVAVYDKGSA